MPRYLLIRIAPIWVLALIVGSLMPGAAKQAIGTTQMQEEGGASHIDPMLVPRHRRYHLLSFGSTTLLLLLIARAPGQRLAAALAVAALGFSLEFAQYRIYRSQMEWFDVTDDVYGVAVASVIGFVPAVRRILVR